MYMSFGLCGLYIAKNQVNEENIEKIIGAKYLFMFEKYF